MNRIRSPFLRRRSRSTLTSRAVRPSWWRRPRPVKLPSAKARSLVVRWRPRDPVETGFQRYLAGLLVINETAPAPGHSPIVQSLRSVSVDAARQVESAQLRSLEPAQLQLLERYRQRWSQLGLSTEPADRPRAEAALAALYRGGGLPPPRMHWAESPQALLARAQELGGKPVWHAVGATVGDLTWRAIWNQLEASQTTRVWGVLGGAVRRRVSDHHVSGASTTAGVPLVSQTTRGRAEVVAGATLQAWYCRGVEHYEGRTGEYWSETDWIGDVLPLFAFSRQVLGLDAPDGLDELIALAESAGPWIALEHDAVICERPQELHLDERGRLHNPSGPALAWRDGHAIYAFEGRRRPSV